MLRYCLIILLFPFAALAQSELDSAIDSAINRTLDESIQNGESRDHNDVYIVYHSDYERLYRNCGLSACCRASVRAMRKEMAPPKKAGEECAAGTTSTSLMCPASHAWCVPLSKISPTRGNTKE